MKLNWPLLALATGAFGIGTTEFAPMGLLPVIATGLKVSVPTAGLLVTGYALGVVAGAPLLTLPTGRLDRRVLLVGLMVLFTLGNALSALAPGYWSLLAARIVTSLCHGAYFGVGSVVAARLAGDGKAAGAVAAVFAGLTVANIGGVPLAAWVGDHVGWRTAFGGIAGIGVVATAALALALPAMPGAATTDVAAELRVLVRRPVVLALLTTAFGSAAMFTVFTYISPILQSVTHVGPGTVTVALVVYGVGLTVGNWLGGRFADRALRGTLVVVLAALVALLLLFAVTMRFAGAGGGDDLRVGRRDLRAGPAAAGARHGGREGGAEPRRLGQHRGVQPRQCRRRGARRRGHRAGTVLRLGRRRRGGHGGGRAGASVGYATVPDKMLRSKP